MGSCSLSQHLRSRQFLPVCSHSDALSIQGIDVEKCEVPVEAKKLAVNKGNNKDKAINVKMGRAIKYPVISIILVLVQKTVPSLLFFWLVFKLVGEFEKSIMQPCECQFI